MDLELQLQGRGDLARQVYRQVRAAILDGRLRRGDRLPPTRELARRHEISRNTVSLAYEWLAAEGLLHGRHGAGSFVAGDRLARAPRPQGSKIRSRSAWQGIRVPDRADDAPRYDFGVGMPDASLFPFDTWRRLLARQVRASAFTGEYGDPAGHPGLRAAIARHVALNRGVNASAEDVVVTNGAQGAFDLVARVLIEPGARVAVEEPGYPPVRMLFASYGAVVAPTRVDAAGIDVDALPSAARVVYVTPSHQFPLGMPMAHARRIALLEWAERRDAVIVEDDYDSEFRFSGRPLETLQAIDRSGRVIYVGSFSKSLLPGLRLGFLVAPPSVGATFRAASYLGGWFVQWPAQAALAALIDSGLLARHVRRMRRVYAARHERILRLLERHFARWLRPVPSLTGLHLTATLRNDDARIERRLLELARQEGVRCDGLSAYFASAPGETGLALGYGAIGTHEIDEGLKRLKRCLARVAAV